MKTIMILHYQLIRKRKTIPRMMLISAIIAFVITIIFYINNRNLITIGNPIFSYFFVNHNQSGTLNAFLVALPILMALIYGDFHYYEKSILPYMLVRKNNKQAVYISNAIFAFLSGFLIVIVFLLFMFLYNLIITYHPESNLSYLPMSVNENNINVAASAQFSVFVDRPYEYILMESILISIYAGFLSLSTYTISLFLKSKIITYVSMLFFSLASMLVLWLFIKPLMTWNLQLVFSPGIVFVKYHTVAILFWYAFFLILNSIGIIIKSRRTDFV